jgi:putative endonuclease
VSSDPRNGIGRRGEDYAAAHLERCGFRIVERNYRTRFGELDIVAFDGRTIAFCEVKTRRVGRRELPPFASLGPRKQAQVRAMSVRWLAERTDRPYARELRFDAIGVWIDELGRLTRLEHLEGAF